MSKPDEYTLRVLAMELYVAASHIINVMQGELDGAAAAGYGIKERTPLDLAEGRAASALDAIMQYFDSTKEEVEG